MHGAGCGFIEEATQVAELFRISIKGLQRDVPVIAGREGKTQGKALAEAIYYACLDAGLSFKISQGCVLTLSPPLTIARADLDRALDIVVDAILAAAPQR